MKLSIRCIYHLIDVYTYIYLFLKLEYNKVLLNCKLYFVDKNKYNNCSNVIQQNI
jgi:hypothetical protein